MEERRSSPEEFLRRCENENQSKGRGSLKIFFGYAAGVGKTYSMLKAAHAARRRGIDWWPVMWNRMRVHRPPNC